MSLFPELEVEQPTSDSEQYELSQSDLSYGAQLYIDYFSDIGNIEEHSKKIKLERMRNRKSELGGMSYEDTFFNDYNIHPQDMKFTIHDVSVSYKYDNAYFNRALDIVSSHTNKDSVPGKTLKWIIEELQTTNNKTHNEIKDINFEKKKKEIESDSIINEVKQLFPNAEIKDIE